MNDFEIRQGANTRGVDAEAKIAGMRGPEAKISGRASTRSVAERKILLSSALKEFSGKYSRKSATTLSVSKIPGLAKASLDTRNGFFSIKNSSISSPV
jgi:hypothetical protein